LTLSIAIGFTLFLSLAVEEGMALSRGLTANDTANAKQAQQLYKKGQYEDAAEIYSRLSIDYPELLVFTRNLGACFYYLRKPEPALSNLREYLRLGQGITSEDRTEVQAWIAEMEKLRDQLAVPSTAGSAEHTTPLSAAALPAGTSTREPAEVQPARPEPSVLAAAQVLSAPPSGDANGKPAAQGEALDLSQKPANDNGATTSESGSRWWLWTSIGAAVAGGIVTAILLSTRSPGRDSTCSSGLSGCTVVGN